MQRVDKTSVQKTVINQKKNNELLPQYIQLLDDMGNHFNVVEIFWFKSF